MGVEPMQMRQWMTQCEAELCSVGFIDAIKAHSTAIRNAQDPSERAREAGRFGGFLRLTRSAARLALAEALIVELGVVPTQHVASMLMKETFGEAAETATLDRFATPGRDASEKHMHEARAATVKHAAVLTRYGSMYAWYVERLDTVVASLRGARRKTRPVRGPAIAARLSAPSQHPSSAP